MGRGSDGGSSVCGCCCGCGGCARVDADDGLGNCEEGGGCDGNGMDDDANAMGGG